MEVLLGFLSVLILVLIIGPMFADRQFFGMVKSEAQALLDGVPISQSRAITAADLENLPSPVRRWLHNANVVGKERVRTIRLEQKGALRTKPEQGWMPFAAVQYFTIEQPGFLWYVKVRMAPLIGLAGRDKLINGHGQMLIKLLSLLPVVNASGQEMDLGTLQRFLAEILWFPRAVIGSRLKWEVIDESAAKVSLTSRGVTASGIVHFGQDGNPCRFTTDRYQFIDGAYQLLPWVALMSQPQSVDGSTMSTRVEAIWKMKSGDFSTFRADLTKVDYNEMGWR